MTAATTSGGNYLLTAGFAPTAGATWQVNLGGIIVNTNDNTVAGDGSHTVPASVSHAFSLSNSVVPTTGFQGVASQFSNGGHNWWGTYERARRAGELLHLGSRQGRRCQRRCNVVPARGLHGHGLIRP